MRHATEESPDDAIRAVIARLARPHKSGGAVIERAAIMAEGGRSAAILEWIECHAGEAEVAEAPVPPRGLHHGTGFGGAAPTRRGPSRYVLPAGALSPD